MKWLLKVCFVLPLLRASHGASSRHLEVLQLAHSQASTHSRASSRALAGFQKYTDELVEEFQRTGIIEDPEVLSAIDIIVGWIEDEHVLRLYAHGNDSLGDNCAAHVQECLDLFFTPIHVQHMVNLTTIVDVERDEHYECRTVQAKCCRDEVDVCDNYTNWRRRDYGRTLEVHNVVGTTDFPDCYEHRLQEQDITTEDPEERQHMESCLTEVYGWHLPMYERYIACKEMVHCCDDPDEICVTHQRDFEHVHCVAYDYINDHCGSGRQCYRNRIATCDEDFCNDLQQRVEIRKAENETAMRILCLLHVIANVSKEQTRTELENCKARTYADEQAFWNITCNSDGAPAWPSIPASLCPDPLVEEGWSVTDVPCVGHFQWQEYGSNELDNGDWDGLNIYCGLDCPGHSTNITRNTSFVIHNDTSWSHETSPYL